MTTSDIQMLSAIFGMVGSLASAWSTYGYEQYPLAEFCNETEIADVDKRNKRRRLGQALGLVLLAFSFFLQIITTI